MTAQPAIFPPLLAVPSCCGPSAAAPAAPVTTRFHFSLNVSDLEQTVAFYEKLFGVPPAKHHGDYAKFELDQPPLVFALVPNAPASKGALSHLGFPVGSVEEVAAARQRLQAAGLQVSCQDATVCGYTRQDKIWVADPDNNFWEIYTVYEDVDPAQVRASFDGVSPLQSERPVSSAVAAKQERSVWEHRVTDGMLERIPHDDESVDEVRLVGTFNSSIAASDRILLLNEALRVLKPGSEIHVHGLVSNVPLHGSLPSLPGMASLVKHVPTEAEPLKELAEAGFRNLRVTKLSESAVFSQGQAEMREIKLTGRKPAESSLPDAQRVVLYKGPFLETVDDGGRVYRRGQRTTVTAGEWDALATSSAAEQFLFIDVQANIDGQISADCSCG